MTANGDKMIDKSRVKGDSRLWTLCRNPIFN